MNILVFLHSYLPGFKSGGPVRTIENMTKSLPGHDFLVVTTDRDLGDTQPYPGIKEEQWMAMGDSQIFYLNEGITLVERIFTYYRVLKSTSFDVLYLQSFFNVRFTMLPLLIFRLIYGYSKPVIIAPRGEFSKGAISLKAWKKRPYLLFIKLTGILRNVIWQASTSDEQNDLLNVFSYNRTSIFKADNIFIAPDIGAVKTTKKKRMSSTEFKVIFVSRISRKKNLSYLLDCMSYLDIPVSLNIFGPIEDEKYWTECEEKIKALPANIQVTYGGSIDHADISPLFSEHDLFFFPTLGENFGHVIIESLSSGTPVLISDQTPWKTDGEGACYAFPLNKPELFVNVLRQFHSHSMEEKERLAARATSLAREFSGIEFAIERNKEMFKFSSKKIKKS